MCAGQKASISCGHGWKLGARMDTAASITPPGPMEQWCRMLSVLQLLSKDMLVCCAGAHDPADSWEWWYRVRCLCGQNAKLGVLLDLPLQLPPQQAIDRWRVRSLSWAACRFSGLLGAL